MAEKQNQFIKYKYKWKKWSSVFGIQQEKTFQSTAENLLLQTRVYFYAEIFKEKNYYA